MDTNGLGCWLSVFPMKILTWRPLASLRSRLILLIILTLLGAQALTVYVVATYQRQEVQAAAVNMLVTSITTLKSAISMVRPEHRPAFVQHASHGQWQLLRDPPPKGARYHLDKGLEPRADGSRRLRRSLRALSRDVNKALEGQSRVAVTVGPQPFMYVSIGPLAGQPPWLRIPLDRVDPPVRTPLLLWWLGSLVAIILIALWFSWHITRPMTRLVKATDQLAQGRPEPVQPSGPREIRRLGERFNAMLASLAQTQRTQRTLLAGLPHDLKGPMARMALRIEMADDPELKRGLQRDLSDMQRMTQQFLDFLRGQDASRLNLKSLRLDQWLSALVQEQASLGRPVTVVGPLPPVQMQADDMALTRLVNNLIDNGLTHGAPPVEISLLLTEPSKAIIRVADHGSGLTPEQYDRAFEPFERLDPARSRTGNVGLGLSLVKGIAIAHGGSVSLGRHASGGLCVDVVLPVASVGKSQ